MRKVLILVSFLSCVLLSTNLVCRLLPSALSSRILSWLLAPIAVVPAILLLLAPLVLLGIYLFRQIFSQERQLKQMGLIKKSNQEILRNKDERLKPYQREIRLQTALFMSFGFFFILPQMIDLIVTYSLDDYQQQQKIDVNLGLASWICILISILITSILSKDLIKKSDKSTEELPSNGLPS